MAKPVMMPQVGQDIETAVILECRVKENEPVNKGEILCVVESDKAVFEIESYDSGILLKIMFQEGEVAQVLAPVAYIGESGEEIDCIEMNIPETGKEKAAPESIERKMNGNQEVLSVEIDPELLNTDNKDKLEAAVKEATNEAVKKIQRIMAEKMKESGFSLPEM